MKQTHIYAVRPRKDKRGVDLISDALPFGRPNAVANAIGYAEDRSRSHDAVIRVYDESGNVIEIHEHEGDFKNWGSVIDKTKSRHAAKRDGSLVQVKGSSVRQLY